jgi:hypothetical protein
MSFSSSPIRQFGFVSNASHSLYDCTGEVYSIQFPYISYFGLRQGDYIPSYSR